jgi:hypothetical protein
MSAGGDSFFLRQAPDLHGSGDYRIWLQADMSRGRGQYGADPQTGKQSYVDPLRLSGSATEDLCCTETGVRHEDDITAHDRRSGQTLPSIDKNGASLDCIWEVEGHRLRAPYSRTRE